MNIEGVHDRERRPDYHHRPRTLDPALTGNRPSRANRRRSTSTEKQSALQIRASNLVKKLGFFTSKLGGAGTRSKQPPEDDDPNVKPHQPFRKIRSMDILRSKPPLMASANSNPLLAGFGSQPFIRPASITRGSQESEMDADLGESKIAERLGTGHTRKPSSSSSNSNSITRGLAVATMVADAGGVRPPPSSVTGPAPESSGKSPHPDPNVRRADLSDSDHNENANGRQDRRSERQHVIVVKEDTNTDRTDTDSALPRSPPPPVPEKDKDREKRLRPSAHPRLSTLPPLNFNFDYKGIPQDSSQGQQRTQRLSPSVIVRPPPFPILELPALPTPVSESARTPIASSSAAPSGSGSATGLDGRNPQSSSSSQSQPHVTTRRGGARLNSMPLLPREGSENPDEDPDHENCCLDEDEEDGDDDDGMSGEADDGDGGFVGSEDEDDDRDSSNLHLSAGIHGHGRKTRSRSPNPNPSRSNNAIASSSDCSPSSSSNSNSSFASKSRGGLPLSFSPRLTLPGLNNTPSLSSVLASLTGGNNTSSSPNPNPNPHAHAHETLSARPSQDREGSTLRGDAEYAELTNSSRDDAADAATPKAVAHPNHTWSSIGFESIGNGRPDYFTTSGASEEHERKSQDSQSSGDDNIIDRMHHQKTKTTGSPGSDDKSLLSSTSPSLRTPTVRDYPYPDPPRTTRKMSETMSPTPVPETFRDRDSSLIPKVIVSGITEANTPYLIPSPTANTKQPPPSQSRRPSIYHHASKSMIELFSVTQAKEAAAIAVDAGKDKDVVGRTVNADNNNGITATPDIKGKGKPWPDASIHENLQALNAKDRSEDALRPSSGRERKSQGQEKKGAPAPGGDGAVVAPSTTLRRQHSMPTFSTAGEPPPYPSFQLPSHLQRFKPLPREDEGREELPPYSNSIRLATVMPRKMEFSSPGVPARDRKWRRVHCVLEGTAFRVYDAPPRVSGVSGLSGWWERKVGVGDVAAGGQGVLGAGPGATASSGATTNIVIGRKEPKRRMKWEEELAAQEEEAQAQQRAAAESEEGRSRASTPAPNGGPEANERPSKEHKARRTVAALLHPTRSRHSLNRDRDRDRDQGLLSSSSSPPSPRSSLHFPRSSISTSNSNSMSAERESLGPSNSNPPSARPSMDISTTSSGLSVSNSASSNSISGMSSNSGVSTPNMQTQTRRGHLRTDSLQSTRSQSPARSSRGHSRNNSRAQSPLNPDAHTQSHPQNHPHMHPHSLSQSYDALTNPYLYHPLDPSELPEPDEKDLIRVYSLQRAESGLASDYLKRKNVVRVRMEGEQFLLQCKDVASVVEWIEALQAATNIALDLDERPMPKGPIFPRRRRRRRHQQATESGATEQPSTTTESASGNGSEAVTS